MESIQNVINVIRPGDYMASIDLKDAFFSVPIYKPHQKYLKFFLGEFYEFTCMPNGYGPAMRAFTKISKVPFSVLRNRGHISVVFVDDSILFGETYLDCLNNIRDTIELLLSLGFTIHPDKSVLVPSTKITFLGFIVDSVRMTLTLTVEKKLKIKTLCSRVLLMHTIKIRDLAKIIGCLVASFQAVTYGPMYYRHLEQDKILALRMNHFNFEKSTSLSINSQHELQWWIENIDNSFRNIRTPGVDLTIHTDASMTGWGATDGKHTTNGLWTETERQYHINVLEILAIQFAILSFCEYKKLKHVKIMCDNTTAISYINNFGGIKSKLCNQVAVSTWEWCIKHDIWVSAAHIPGIKNTIADAQSRKLDDSTEWQLNPCLFKKLVKKFGMPEVDLMASRANRQIDTYVSWHPQPGAKAIDAFSISWKEGLLYVFPPFSIIGQTISKIIQDDSDVILVVPDWNTQYWYPLAVNMADQIMKIKPHPKNLQLTHDQSKQHQLHQKLGLLVIKVIITIQQIP